MGSSPMPRVTSAPASRRRLAAARREAQALEALEGSFNDCKTRLQELRLDTDFRQALCELHSLKGTSVSLRFPTQVESSGGPEAADLPKAPSLSSLPGNAAREFRTPDCRTSFPVQECSLTGL